MSYWIERDPVTGERTGNIIPAPGHDAETGVHKNIAVPKPATATLTGGPGKAFECTLHEPGEIKFRMAAHAANHFNRAHADKREDKDSWRKYMKNITLE